MSQLQGANVLKSILLQHTSVTMGTCEAELVIKVLGCSLCRCGCIIKASIPCSTVEIVHALKQAKDLGNTSRKSLDRTVFGILTLNINYYYHYYYYYYHLNAVRSITRLNEY